MMKTITLAILICLCAVAQEGPPGAMQFILRIEPVRQGFSLQNMTEEERTIAMQHILYLKRLQTERRLTFAGQVFDAKGFWGVYVVNAPDAQTATALLTADPLVKANLFRGEALPFRTVLDLSNSLAAKDLSGGKLQIDIEYAKPGGESLKMDAWIPDGPGPHPAVILVHGGGWKSGDKQFNFTEIFEPLSKARLAWFSVNYRLAPKHVYPAAVEDVVEAVRHIKAHAGEYKIDPKRIAIMGESAGGHIAALVGARYGRDLGLAAVVPFYPATDFIAVADGPDKSDKAYRGAMQFIGAAELNDAERQRLREASPVTYVQKGMPPFLFVHGTAD